MLYLDCRMLQGSGIATYLHNLIRSYKKKDHQLDLQYLVKNYTSIISAAPYYQNQHRFDSKIYSIHEQLFYPKRMGKGDVLHVPHYNAPLMFSGKLIVTVHDLCHYVMKDYFNGLPKRIYAGMFMKLVLIRADHIITVSHFTKNEIIKHFRIDPGKITVIHNGVDSYFYPRTEAETQRFLASNNLPERYLLYVGNIKPHKNISRLILAYYRAKSIAEDLPKLVICGRHDQNYNVVSQLYQSGAIMEPFVKENILFLGYAKYEDLPYLYSGADLFLFPSLYEGFGIPPLEAMACGTPALASNTSSLPEVLGDCALLVDPYNPADIAEGIIKLWNNPSLQKEMVDKGLIHVQKYNWESSAEEHLEIYQKHVAKKRNILFVDQYRN